MLIFIFYFNNDLDWVFEKSLLCVCVHGFRFYFIFSAGAIQSTLYATDRLPIGLSGSAQAVSGESLQGAPV